MSSQHSKTTSDVPEGGRIDTHIHIMTPSYTSALEKHGDPSGWTIPEWTAAACSNFMRTVGIRFAVLSVSAPGAPMFGPVPEGRAFTRTLNEEVSRLVKSQDISSRAGFFASLPDWNDVEGWVFGEQREAFGVIIFTSYGDKLPGDPSFRPIWAKLNHYRALIFMHPTAYQLTPQMIGNFLPSPVVDYPQASTRAAVDIISSGTLHACPDVDLILSHAGGTLPYLMQRAFSMLDIPGIREHAGVGAKDAFEDAKRLYYDLALSTTPAQLLALLSVADPAHILFGSDYPHAPTALAIHPGLLAYAEFVRTHPDAGALAPRALLRNSYTLLASHAAVNSTPLPQEKISERAALGEETSGAHSLMASVRSALAGL